MFKPIGPLILVGAVLSFFSPTAHSETFMFTFPTHADAATRQFVEQIEKSPLLAAADLQIKSIPAEAIIKPGQELLALENGTIALALVPFSSIAAGTSEKLPHATVLANPTVVSNPTEQFAIQDSVYGDKIAAELGDRQLVTLAFWNRAASAIFARVQVKTLEDLKGQKIVSPDPSSRRFIQALGATSPPVPAGEIYSAIERGTIDASEAPAPSFEQAFPTVFRGHTLLSNFSQPLGFLVTHQKTWLRINQLQRDALGKAAKSAEQSARRVVLAEQERLPMVARDNQVQVVNFVELAQPFIARDARAVWLRDAGRGGRPALELLEKIKLDMTRPRTPERGGTGPTPKPPTILFATIRNDERKPDLASRFGLEKLDNPVLSCGRVEFAIPADRKPGESYEGGISLPPGSPVVTGGDCYTLISQVADKSGGSLVIYVHGFWNTMAFAVRRSIAVASDLGISAPVLVWSWPSAGDRSMYPYDRNSVSWSRVHFQQSINTFLSDARIKRITLVSHSMGSRLALNGLETATGHRRKGVIVEAIFVAPDVEVSEFRQSTRLFGGGAGRMTLYATSTDRALLISMDRYQNREALAGLGGQRITVLKGLDSVDATEVEAFWQLWRHNHTLPFEVAEVMNDLRALVVQGLAVDRRGLKRMTKDQLPYWLIPAAQ